VLDTLAAMGMPEMGEDFCWKAVGLNPRYTPAWHNLGNVYSVLGEWDQAMDAYGKVLALRPDSSATRQNQAIASMMRSKNAPAQGGDDNPMSQKMDALSKAVESGDIKAAQQAYADIKKTMAQAPGAGSGMAGARGAAGS